MRAAAEAGLSTMVNCEAGRSRSAAAVIAHLEDMGVTREAEESIESAALRITQDLRPLGVGKAAAGSTVASQGFVRSFRHMREAESTIPEMYAILPWHECPVGASVRTILRAEIARRAEAGREVGHSGTTEAHVGGSADTAIDLVSDSESDREATPPTMEEEAAAGDKAGADTEAAMEAPTSGQAESPKADTGYGAQPEGDVGDGDSGNSRFSVSDCTGLDAVGRDGAGSSLQASLSVASEVGEASSMEVEDATTKAPSLDAACEPPTGDGHAMEEAQAGQGKAMRPEAGEGAAAVTVALPVGTGSAHVMLLPLPLRSAKQGGRPW